MQTKTQLQFPKLNKRIKFIQLLFSLFFLCYLNLFSQGGRISLDSIHTPINDDATGDVPSCFEDTCTNPFVRINDKFLFTSSESNFGDCCEVDSYRERKCNGYTEIIIDRIATIQWDSACYAKTLAFVKLRDSIYSTWKVAVERIGSNGPVRDGNGPVYDSVDMKKLNPINPEQYSRYLNIIASFRREAFIATVKHITNNWDLDKKNEFPCPNNNHIFRSVSGYCTAVRMFKKEEFNSQNYMACDTIVKNLYPEDFTTILNDNTFKIKIISYNSDGSINIINPITGLIQTKYRDLSDTNFISYFDSLIICRFVGPDSVRNDDGFIIEYFTCGTGCCKEQLDVCWNDSLQKLEYSQLTTVPTTGNNNQTCPSMNFPPPLNNSNNLYPGETRIGCSEFCIQILPQINHKDFDAELPSIFKHSNKKDIKLTKSKNNYNK